MSQTEDIDLTEIEVRRENDGFRFFVPRMDIQAGEIFQSKCRSREWSAALIVWEKYKKKLNLSHKCLNQIRDFAEFFVQEQTATGKRPHMQFIIQVCTEEAKKIGKSNFAQIV